MCWPAVEMTLVRLDLHATRGAPSRVSLLKLTASGEMLASCVSGRPETSEVSVRHEEVSLEPILELWCR